MKIKRGLLSLLSATSLCASVSAFSSSALLARRRREHGAAPVPSFSSLPKAAPLLRSATRLHAGPNRANLRKKQNMRTLQRFLEVECWKLPHLKSMDRTLNAAADACRQINRIVQRAKTDDLYGAALDPITGELLEENVQGEVQQQLDVLCNTYMLRAFCGGSDGAIIAVASEEEDTPRSSADVMGYDPAEANLFRSSSNDGFNNNNSKDGEYVAVFDPIDGSKNIDSSLPVGTIFGIYKVPEGIKPGPDGYDMDMFLQRGTNMVAAGYCLYSATTVLVLTMGNGAHGFTLDPDTNKFMQTHPNIRIPEVGNIYSFNEAYYRGYGEPIRKFLDNMKAAGTMGGKPVSARHVGAMVADVHNILINGGIYGYPATSANKDGKLRLLYESAPMAMIMEQAGGAGSTGTGRILDVLPEKEKGIHVRVPTFLGSPENVFELDQFHRFYVEDEEE